MTINITFSNKTVRVAVELNGAIASAITELPQRTWVGLSAREVIDIVEYCDGVGWDVAERIEAKLREKNGYAEEKNT